MNETVLRAKAESLRRCLARLRATCPATAEALAADVDAQDIVSVNLIRAVQLAVDMATHEVAALGLPPPGTMAESFQRLETAGRLPPELSQRLRGAVGFRNLAVHAYERIDWTLVHTLATRRLEDLETLARHLLARP
ncbi:MAG: DUF86 domain-containing protein [Xanthomonadaceae bacterium]|nr:DUF86 domain-containing protein [Xanthomonadaceae bacterium]